MKGDIKINNNGVTRIEDEVIINTDIARNANIQMKKLILILVLFKLLMMVKLVKLLLMIFTFIIMVMKLQELNAKKKGADIEFNVFADGFDGLGGRRFNPSIWVRMKQINGHNIMTEELEKLVLKMI